MAVTQQEKNNSIRDTIVTAIAPCIWGSTYIVTTEMLPPDHPLTAAAIRALPVGIAMLALTRSLPRGHWWWRLMVLGMLNIGVFQALLFTAAYRLPGGVAATVGAIQPLVVVMLSWLALQAQPSRRTWIAAISGFIGVGLLVLGPAAKLDAIGIGAALAGAVAMAFGTVLTKRWQSPLSLNALTAWQLTFGGLFLLPLAIAFEDPVQPLSVANVAGYIYLSVIGGGLAYALWFRGIGRLRVSAVSILGLLSPVVATLLGFLLLHQSLTGVQLCGVALVLGSVWLGQRQSQPAGAVRRTA